MYPPKKSPYPWEIDNDGLALPAPIDNAVSPPYVNPSVDPGGLALPAPKQQPIDNGGLALPAPVSNEVSPPLQGQNWTQPEQTPYANGYQPSSYLQGLMQQIRANPQANDFGGPGLNFGSDEEKWNHDQQMPANVQYIMKMLKEGHPAQTPELLSRNAGYDAYKIAKGHHDAGTAYTGVYNPQRYVAPIGGTNPSPVNTPPTPGGDTIPGGTPPPYTNPSMTPGGNMSNIPTPGITRPTGGGIQPKLPQAGGNMNVLPISGQLGRSEFQASRKRIPNYVGR